MDYRDQRRLIIVLCSLLGIALVIIGVLVGVVIVSSSKKTNDNVKISEVSENNTKSEGENIDDEELITENGGSQVNSNSSKSTSSKASNNTNTSENNESYRNNDSSSNGTVSSTTTNGSVNYSDKDVLVIDELESIERETDEVLNSSDTTSAKDKAKGIFISLVDFIFYDGQIKGVTFNELTDSGKEKVLKIASSIDNKIENKFPSYKEKISDKASSAFKKASQTIREGASSFSNFSREKLGDDNYNSIIDAKDELVTYTKKAASIIKTGGGSLFSTVKDKVKSWYERFRSN